MEQNRNTLIVPVKCLMMNTQNQSGTLEQENLGVCKLEELLTAFDQWIQLQGWSKNAPKDYRNKLVPFFRFLQQRQLLDSQNRFDLLGLDETILADYQTHLFEYISPRTGKKLSCNTQINCLSYLKTFFRFLHKTKKIVLNTAEIIQLPRHPQLLPVVLLSSTEMQRLLAQPDTQTVLGYRDRTILETFWSSGVRLSELIGLNIQDIQFDRSLLAVRQGKGQRERIIPIGQNTQAWLHQYIHVVRPVLLRGQKTDILFLNRHSQPMKKSGWQKKLTLYVRRARIKTNFTTHCFRHMLASDMLRAGADLRHIQQMLGHESLQTTQRYLHLVKKELKKIHAHTHPRETETSTTLAVIRYHGSRHD